MSPNPGTWGTRGVLKSPTMEGTAMERVRARFRGYTGVGLASGLNKI
jgi:hypothetical protein